MTASSLLLYSLFVGSLLMVLFCVYGFELGLRARRTDAGSLTPYVQKLAALSVFSAILMIVMIAFSIWSFVKSDPILVINKFGVESLSDYIYQPNPTETLSREYVYLGSATHTSGYMKTDINLSSSPVTEIKEASESNDFPLALVLSGQRLNARCDDNGTENPTGPTGCMTRGGFRLWGSGGQLVLGEIHTDQTVVPVFRFKPQDLWNRDTFKIERLAWDLSAYTRAVDAFFPFPGPTNYTSKSEPVHE